MNMKWATSIYGPENIKESEEGVIDAIKYCAQEINEQLSGDKITFLTGFISSHFKGHYSKVPEYVNQELNPETFIGCSAGGLIGGGKEIENKPCVALTAAHLPNVNTRTFYVEDKDLPDLDASQDEWKKLIGVHEEEKAPYMVVIPDPFSFNTDSFIRGLDFAYPDSIKIGGLASGAKSANQNALFLDDQLYSKGLVGLVLDGDLIVDTVVAQGCKPIGRPLTITKCNKNILFELNDKPAIMALKNVLDGLSEGERQLIKESVFLGIAMNEMQVDFKQGDFLIRNILGIEPKSGAIVVGELLGNQKTIQFHVRDAASSADDLRCLLKQYKDESLDGGKRKASGALLFSCLGRGEYLYKRANHDSDCLRSYLGPVPIGGFFCNGEIGPLSNQTFLHGYTSSFGIFRENVK